MADPEIRWLDPNAKRPQLPAPTGAPTTDVAPSRGSPDIRWIDTTTAPTTTSPAPAPAPAATPEGPIPASDVLSGMVTNLPSSAKKNVTEMIEGVSQMVRHPIDTAVNLSKLATSITPLGPALSIAAKKAKEMGLDTDSWLGNYIATIDDPKNALGQMLKDRYGSIENVKKTLRDDPAGVLMDIGTVFSGGELAAPKVASLVSKLGATGKVVSGIEKAGKVSGTLSKIDPVNLILQGGADVPLLNKLPFARKGLAERVTDTIPKYMGWRSGLGPEVATDIKNLAHPDSPYGNVGRNEYLDAFGNKVTAKDVVDRAEQGIKNMRNDANTGYTLNKDDWINQGGKLDMSVIDQAEKDMLKSVHTSTGMPLLNKEQLESFQKMADIIEDTRKQGQNFWTVENLDALKRNLSKVKVPLGDKEMMRVRTALSNSVKDNILHNAQGTKYHESMMNYHAAMDDLDEMRSALSLGKDAPEHVVMSKLQSVLRNNVSTQYGTRGALVDMLEKEGRVNLRPWLLGMAAKADAPRGIAGAIAAGSGASGTIGGGVGALLGGVSGALTGAGIGSLAGIPLGMADMASRSPKWTGRTSYALGRMRDLPQRIFPQVRGATVVTGRTNPIDEQARGGPIRYAHGGRVGFADGGMFDYGSDVMANVMGPPPAAMRGATQAATHFTPISSLNAPVQIQPSRAVFGQGPEPPRLPSGTAASGQGEAPGGIGSDIGKAAQQWNKQQEDKYKREDAERLRKIQEEAAKAKAAGAGATTTEGGLKAPGTNIGAYDQTFGLPDTTPLAGDSYEAKVGGFESGGDDTAVNKGSGAAGRYQFLPSTAEGLRKSRPDLNISDNWRTNVDDQKKLMKAYTDISRDQLTKINQPVTGGRLYMMHLLGQGGGSQVLANLDAPISQTISAGAISGNPFLKNFATGRDLLAYFEKRFG